jgi:hypothetical protein
VKPVHRQVVEVLKGVRGKTLSQIAVPTGLPRYQTNEDVSQDGKYMDDGTTDPGQIGGVTGTGNGPIIGR